MEREYTVLRDLAQGFPTGPFDGFGPGTAGQATNLPAAPNVEHMTLDKKDLRDIVREPDVRAIAPVMPTKLIHPVVLEEQVNAVDSAAGGGPTWGVVAVGADTSSYTGAGATIAVLDTGIDSAHPAFAGVNLVQKDFSGDGDGDIQGHGTHCAGTIFGRDVNGHRIGVAPGVTNALIGKVLGDGGNGTSDAIFEGIQWAVQQGADVISMSIGFDFPGYVDWLIGQGYPNDLATSMGLEGYRANLRMFDALMGYVTAATPFGHTPVLVAAAGNESKRNINPQYEIGVSIPAAAQGMVSVGALGQSDDGLTIAYFSNTFPTVAAPGVQVLSAKAGSSDLVSFNGTSMATPHVAGVLALWWEQVRSLQLPQNAATVTARLLAHADTSAISGSVDTADRGVGLVKAP